MASALEERQKALERKIERLAQRVREQDQELRRLRTNQFEQRSQGQG